MGFHQSSTKSPIHPTMIPPVRSGDLFSAVLAGFGIWTKSSPVVKTQLAPSSAYPLRVIHVKDVNPEMAGRMVISGRMTDVCEALNRLTT